MDLINRDELEKELQNSCNDYSDTIHIVWDMPTVEAIPLSVIDKIRAEIDKARFVDKDTRICKNALASGLEVAMQIIDKYKAESEE